MRRDLLEASLKPFCVTYILQSPSCHIWIILTYHDKVRQQILILTFGHNTQIFGGYYEILGTWGTPPIRETCN